MAVYLGNGTSTLVVTIRYGQIFDPAIQIRPDFYYPAKSGSDRISCLTPDRIFSISSVLQSVLVKEFDNSL